MSELTDVSNKIKQSDDADESQATKTPNVVATATPESEDEEKVSNKRKRSDDADESQAKSPPRKKPMLTRRRHIDCETPKAVRTDTPESEDFVHPQVAKMPRQVPGGSVAYYELLKNCEDAQGEGKGLTNSAGQLSCSILVMFESHHLGRIPF